MSDKKKTEVLGSSFDHPQPQSPSPPPIGNPQFSSSSAPQKTQVLSSPGVGSKIIGFIVFMQKDGTYAGQIRHLGTRTIIGRDPRADILIDDPSASAQHVAIKIDKANEDEDSSLQYFLQDLATTNGSLVNGEKVVRVALSDGDKIEIGNTIFVFKQV